MLAIRIFNIAMTLFAVGVWAWLIYSTGHEQGLRHASRALAGQQPTAELKRASIPEMIEHSIAALDRAAGKLEAVDQKLGSADDALDRVDRSLDRNLGSIDTKIDGIDAITKADAKDLRR
jgi:hypothetical protein